MESLKVSTGIDEDEDGLDPRIQIELEKLNSATDVINKLEMQLDEANTVFRILMNESMKRLKASSSKLGSSVIRARPYYEALELAKRAQQECQRATQKFQRATEIHKAAKETVALAEARFMSKRHEWQFDNAWQEMLNHATIKVTEAENQKSESGREHQKRALLFNAAEQKVQLLEQRLKRNIAKSRPYFQEKATCQARLDAQKTHITHLEDAIARAKGEYSDSLRRLEEISEEIHLRRSNKSGSASPRGPREPGVGAELEPVNLELPHSRSLPMADAYKYESGETACADDNTSYDFDLDNCDVRSLGSMSRATSSAVSEADDLETDPLEEDLEELKQRVRELAVRDDVSRSSESWENELTATIDKLDNALLMRECEQELQETCGSVSNQDQCLTPKDEFGSRGMMLDDATPVNELSRTNEFVAPKSDDAAASGTNESAVSRSIGQAASSSNNSAVLRSNDSAVSRSSESAASRTKEFHESTPSSKDSDASWSNETAPSSKDSDASRSNESAASRTNKSAAPRSKEFAESAASSKDSDASKSNGAAASRSNESAASRSKEFAELRPNKSAASSKDSHASRSNESAGLRTDNFAASSLNNPFASRLIDSDSSQSNVSALSRSKECVASRSNKFSSSRIKESAESSKDSNASRSDESVALNTNNSAASKSNDPLTSYSNNLFASRTNDSAASKSNDPLTSYSNNLFASRTNDSAASKSNDPLTSYSNNPFTSGTNDSTASSLSDLIASRSHDSAENKSKDPVASRSNNFAHAALVKPVFPTPTIEQNRSSHNADGSA